MKSILVATDGSEAADRAVGFAAGLAKESAASLLIINVIGDYGLPSALLRNPNSAWLEETLASQSAAMVKTAQDRAHKLGVQTIVLESRHGDVAQAIIDYGKEKDVDAIVVGKRGWGGIAGLLLGSVSQKLVNLANRVVMVVP